MALEWTKQGSRVNAIGPAYFEIDLVAELRVDPERSNFTNERASQWLDGAILVNWNGLSFSSQQMPRTSLPAKLSILTVVGTSGHWPDSFSWLRAKAKMDLINTFLRLKSCACDRVQLLFRLKAFLMINLQI